MSLLHIELHADFPGRDDTQIFGVYQVPLADDRRETAQAVQAEITAQVHAAGVGDEAYLRFYTTAPKPTTNVADVVDAITEVYNRHMAVPA